LALKPAIILVTVNEDPREQSIRDSSPNECEAEQQILGSAAQLLSVKAQEKQALAPGEAVPISWDARQVQVPTTRSMYLIIFWRADPAGYRRPQLVRSSPSLSPTVQPRRPASSLAT
jgi:hypothetical protein